MKRQTIIIPSLLPVSPVSFPKTVCHKHNSNAAWAYYGQPSCNTLPSPAPWPGPSSVVLVTQHPRTEGGLCDSAGGGGRVFEGEARMMSSCGMEGANQTLRKLCHLLLSRSIQGYRSAVNWELPRGHFFPPELCKCVCVWEKGGEKKGGRQTSREVHCGHANVVEHKQGHKDVTKLNFQNITTGAFIPLVGFFFQTAMTSSTSNLSLNMIPMMPETSCQALE